MTRCMIAICAASLFVLMGPGSMAEAGDTTAFGTNPGGSTSIEVVRSSAPIQVGNTSIPAAVRSSALIRVASTAGTATRHNTRKADRTLSSRGCCERRRGACAELDNFCQLPCTRSQVLLACFGKQQHGLRQLHGGGFQQLDAIHGILPRERHKVGHRPNLVQA